MASTRQLIDEWAEAGVPREQATRMVLALEEHAQATAVDKATFSAELEKLRTELRSEMDRLRAELRAELDSKIAALETHLMTKVVGLVVVQLGLFWAITRL